MSVVGTAYVRVKLISDKLAEDLNDSIKKSFQKANLELIGRKAGDRIGRSIVAAAENHAVAVEVNADTAKARKELDHLTSQHRAVDIQSDVDTTGATMKLDALDDDRTITLQADADTAGAEKKLDGAAGKKRVSEMLAEADAKKATEQLDEAADKPRTATIKADSDTTNAKHDLDKTAEKRRSTIQADADTGRASMALRWLARIREAIIRPVVDKKAYAVVEAALMRLSGGRVLKELGESLKDTIFNLDMIGPKFAGIAAAILVVVAALGSLVGWAGIAINQLAALAALAIPIPGILAGMVLPLIALSIGMKDLTSKKATGAMKKLRDQFAAMKKSISASYWKTALKPFEEFGNKTLPTISTGMSKVAQSTGTMVGSILRALGTRSGLQNLSTIFTNTANGTKLASVGAGIFAGALIKLTAVGSSYLPSISAWFNQISRSFDGWVNRISSDGSLQRWVTNGIASLRLLGDIAVNTWGILTGIGDAAEKAGGGGLVTLNNALQRMNDTINSMSGQKNLTLFFSASDAAMAKAGDGLRAFVTGFMSFFPTLNASMVLAGESVQYLGEILGGVFANSVFQVGFQSMFIGLASGMQSLVAAGGPLGQVLGSLAYATGALAMGLGPVLSSAISAIAPAMVMLAQSFAPVIVGLGGMLAGILNSLGPLITTLATVLIPPLTGTLMGLAVPITTVANALMVALYPAIQMSGPLMNALGLGLVQVATMFGQMATMIAPFVGTLISVLVPVLIQLTQLLVSILVPVVEMVGSALMLLAGPINQIIGLFSQLLYSIAPFISQIVAALIPAILQIVAAIGPLIVMMMSQLVPVIVQIMAALVPIITMLLTQLTPVITQLLDMLGGLFIQVLVMLLQAVLQLIQAFAPLISQLIVQLLPVVFQLVAAFGPLIQQLLDVLVPVIIQLGQTFAPLIMILVEQLLPVVLQLIQAFAPLIGQLIQALIPAILRLVVALSPLLAQLVVELLPVIMQLLIALMPFIELLAVALVEAFIEVARAVVPMINVLVKDLAPILLELIRVLLPPLVMLFLKLVHDVLPVLVKLFNLIVPVIVSLLGTIMRLVVMALPLFIKGVEGLIWLFKGLVAGVGLIIAGFLGFLDILTKVIAAVINFFTNSNFGESMRKLGSAMINGLVNGFSGVNLGAFLVRIFGEALNAVKSFLGIHSPSRVFADIGKNVGLGLIVGLNGMTSAVAKAGTSMVSAAIPSGGLNVPISVPHLATGGVVSASGGGTLAMIAEARRDERVEPLDANGMSRRDYALLDAIKSMSGKGGESISIGNITIPLEDLAQLKDLNDFIDMLRVLKRKQG